MGTCERCDGVGRVAGVAGIVYGIMDAEACPACGGTGEQMDHDADVSKKVQGPKKLVPQQDFQEQIDHLLGAVETLALRIGCLEMRQERDNDYDRERAEMK